MHDSRRTALQAAVVAAAALAASLTMILLVFPNQGLVANAGDPYDYGKIAHGFVEHGFDKLTRLSAMFYPHALFTRIARDAGTTWELDEVVDDDNNAVVAKRMIVEHPFDTIRKVVVVLNVFVATLVALGRYSVPILPLLAILAAFGVDTLIDRQRARPAAFAAAVGVSRA